MIFFVSGPESKTTTSIHSYQQKISSKINHATGPATTEDKTLALTHPEALSQATIK